MRVARDRADQGGRRRRLGVGAAAGRPSRRPLRGVRGELRHLRALRLMLASLVPGGLLGGTAMAAHRRGRPRRRIESPLERRERRRLGGLWQSLFDSPGPVLREGRGVVRRRCGIIGTSTGVMRGSTTPPRGGRRGGRALAGRAGASRRWAGEATRPARRAVVNAPRRPRCPTCDVGAPGAGARGRAGRLRLARAGRRPSPARPWWRRARPRSSTLRRPPGAWRRGRRLVVRAERFGRAAAPTPR